MGVAALCLTASVFAINGLAEPHERPTGELQEKAQADLQMATVAKGNAASVGNEQGLVDPDSRSTGGHYDGIWANYSKWANTGIIGGTTFHPIESDFPLRKGTVPGFGGRDFWGGTPMELVVMA